MTTLEVKDTITEMKNSVHGFNSRLDTVKERNSEIKTDQKKTFIAS